MLESSCVRTTYLVLSELELVDCLPNPVLLMVIHAAHVLLLLVFAPSDQCTPSHMTRRCQRSLFLPHHTTAAEMRDYLSIIDQHPPEHILKCARIGERATWPSMTGFDLIV